MNRNMNIHHQERNTFLPMLCSRPSIKDVSLPRWKNNNNNNNPPSSSSSSSSSSNEPLSPRIGCMGQVKRNNKIAGFPSSSLSHKLISTTTTTTTTSSSSFSPVIIKYTKLKNIFITPKNLINTTPSTTRTRHHHHHQRVFIGKGNSSEGVTTKKGTKNLIGCSSPSSSSSIGLVSIDEMDPPLPVVQIKKEKVGEEDNKDSLWKRRKSGSLQSLQLQQHHPRISLQPTTV